MTIGDLAEVDRFRASRSANCINVAGILREEGTSIHGRIEHAATEKQ